MNVFFKYGIVTIVLVMSHLNIFAQTEQKMLSYGISIGGTNDKPFKNKLYGYSAGLYVKYNINEMLSASFEPKYMQREIGKFDLKKVFSADSPFLSDVVSSDLQLNTVEMPFLFNVTLFDMGFKPKVFCGFLVNYNLKANTITRRTHIVGDKTYENVKTYADITKRVKMLDYAAEIGIGGEFKVSFLVLSVNVSYKVGLSNINNVVDYPDFKCNTFGLSIGIGM